MRDLAIRQRAFEFLTEAHDRLGSETLPWRILSAGFVHQGQQIRLIGPQGIFKPAAMALPLSIQTAPPRRGTPRPYEDNLRDDGTLDYRYRGSDPEHRDNRGLRACWREQIPLIYLRGVAKGEYLTCFPVHIVADHRSKLSFLVELHDSRVLDLPVTATGEPAALAPIERKMRAVLTRRRFHQGAFRARVLAAYRRSCAVCKLQHTELLDAAHIVADSAGGIAHETNGLALCKLHHAAFDSNILGITPAYRVEIREDILEEVDGPMLVAGLQGFQGQRLLVVPRSPDRKPSREFLAQRYDAFKKAS